MFMSSSSVRGSLEDEAGVEGSGYWCRRAVTGSASKLSDEVLSVWAVSESAPVRLSVKGGGRVKKGRRTVSTVVEGQVIHLLEIERDAVPAEVRSLRAHLVILWRDVP
jgi:hypothetical protein